MLEEGKLEFLVRKVGVSLRENHSFLTGNSPFATSYLEVYEYAKWGRAEWLRLQCNHITAGNSVTATKL